MLTYWIGFVNSSQKRVNLDWEDVPTFLAPWFEGRVKQVDEMIIVNIKDDVWLRMRRSSKDELIRKLFRMKWYILNLVGRLMEDET